MKVFALLFLLVLLSGLNPFPRPHALRPFAHLTQEQQRPADQAFVQAVEFDQMDEAKRMLATGANPNARTFNGTSALMFAARNGNLEMVSVLLASGADPNLQNKDGMDALMAATNRGHDEIAKMLKRAGASQLSEQFVKDIQAIARRFEKRLQQTRDFAPLLKEFFAKRFLDCHVETMLERKENGIFSQIGNTRLTPDVAKQLSRAELRRHLVIALNFFHLSTLYRISRYEWGTGQRAAIDIEEQEYPRAVHDLLKKNPAAMQPSTTVEEEHARVLPLEQALTITREHLLMHPPEAKDAFGKNLQRIGNNDYNSKFWEVELYKLSDKEAEGSRKCLGRPVHRLAVIKVPPFYRLFFVELGQGFEIGAMLCTEPPCSD